MSSGDEIDHSHGSGLGVIVNLEPVSLGISQIKRAFSPKNMPKYRHSKTNLELKLIALIGVDIGIVPLKNGVKL